MNVSILNQLFPLNGRRFGQCGPPLSFRANAAKIGNWRRLGKRQQNELIEIESKSVEALVTNTRSHRSRKRVCDNGEDIRTPHHSVDTAAAWAAAASATTKSATTN